MEGMILRIGESLFVIPIVEIKETLSLKDLEILYL